MPRFSGATLKRGPLTHAPSMLMAPLSMLTKPAIARSSVVLPQPELPTMQPMSPSARSSDSVSITGAPGP